MATVTGDQVRAALAAFDRYPRDFEPGNLHVMRQSAMRAALEAAEKLREDEIAGDPHVVGEAIITRNGRRCEARRCGDEMLCGRCGLAWSPGDESPPACSPVERRLSIRRESDR